MIPATYIAVLLLALLSGLTTLIGVALAIYFKKSIKGIVVGVGFSTGIMLLISFFELIPESIGAAGILKPSIAVFLGILLTAALNFIIPHTHLFKENGDGSLLKTAYLVALGLVLHDFPEGFAMANSYIFSPASGLLIALGIAIHNIPEEFAMAAPLVLVKKKSFLFKVAFLSGLAEPAGAVAGLFAVHFMPALNPLFMAFAAGAMIFVSIHELLPMAARYRRTSLFILGVVLSVLVYIALAMLISQIII
ncbi:ZIP family metal transporter [Archaeoglobus veneficus]|uniref:Zinc/iron permease n=1 Tax=Archaeoglobus veneficus (strain DSM 11195 / SNP6) TaxID=693661 RepID=F2KP36_ARCVS|nr:ZIP family metal transporter [Archaeoglobus veneficus]AEA46344.1 zinc/iron permease [Archaeoglobus veneficus SNP6]